MRLSKKLLSAILFSGIAVNATWIIYSFLIKIKPFNFYLNITETCFVAGLFFGLVLAITIKSTKLGLLVGLLPIVLSNSIGGAEQVMVSIVFAFLFTLGFLGGFVSINILMKIFPAFPFVLDIGPKQH